MGFDGSSKWLTVSDVIKETISEISSYGIIVESGYGRRGAKVWFAVIEKDGYRFATVVLLEKHNGTWMRKVMDEFCHPFYYHVPKKVWKALNRKPIPKNLSEGEVKNSEHWRENVKQLLGC